MKVKTLIESLRTIVTKLGGTIEPNESVKSLVSEIADKIPGEAFVVRLTPTEQDFSGYYDKTPAEIAEAFNAGKRIIFNIPEMQAAIDVTQYGFYTTVTGEFGVDLEANVIYNDANGSGYWLLGAIITTSDPFYPNGDTEEEPLGYRYDTHLFPLTQAN